MLHCEPVPAFNDNYIWMLHRDGGRDAWVVDPGDAAPVTAALDSRGLRLAGVLVTHHHPDHVGGVASLCAGVKLPVIGPAGSPAGCINRPVEDGDRVEVLGLNLAVIAVPGHTLDHIAYFTESETPPMLFCGDTLFAGGCGRVFEGTYEMMHASLSRLAALPTSTRVYCAHEYTLGNLHFARAVEPDNGALARRERDARACRERGEPTVPSTLELELATNPFLRCGDQQVRAAAALHSGSEPAPGSATFAAVRNWKDHF